jgi:CO/xanthine dehydrogenase FAD-binding subunit
MISSRIEDWPLATLHAVETSPIVNERFPALAQAAHSMAEGKGCAARSVERPAEAAAAAAAAAESRSITDIRALLEYRRDMVRVLTRRALNQAWAEVTRAESGKGGLH